VYLLISFASGGAFFGGLIFLYKAISESDVSVASTQVGVLTSIFTYIFSFLILKEVLPLHNAVAISFLILGMLFLGRVGRGIVWHAIGAGALIAISFVLLKWTFTVESFVNGVFWTRVGFIGSAIASLVSGKARREVKSTAKRTKPSSKLIFVINKLIAGAAFLLLYYAILLGNVTTINALLGLQFLFVFLIALAIRNRLPGVEEDLEKKTLKTKIIGIALILAGFLSVLL